MTATETVRFRLLDVEVQLRTQEATVAEAVRRVGPAAVHAKPPREILELAVAVEDEAYCLRWRGGSRVERSLALVAPAVLEIAQAAMARMVADAVGVSAVTLVHEGRAVLLVGEPGSGRSTLALAMAMAGHAVGGDRVAFVQDRRAAPAPGRFSVWSPSLGLLAELPGGDRHEALKADPTWPTRLLLDPTDLGRPWRVDTAAVAGVIFLEPNFGGRSRMRPIGQIDMSRLVMHQSIAPQAGGVGWVRDVWSMVAGAEIAVLELGTLATAVDAVSTFLARRLPAGHLHST